MHVHSVRASCRWLCVCSHNVVGLPTRRPAPTFCTTPKNQRPFSTVGESTSTLSASEMKYDHFQLGHFLRGVTRPFLAEPTFFQSAIRHQILTPLWTPINMDVAGLQLPREPHRGVHVFRENPGC